MMDDMVGADYERGLGQLKALLENSPVPAMPDEPAGAEPAAADGATPAQEPVPADEQAPDASEPAEEDGDDGQGAGAIA